MSDDMYDKEDFSITIRRYDGTWAAHCWHRTGTGFGHSWSNFTQSEDNHWEMIKTHIRVAHTKTKEEKTNGDVRANNGTSAEAGSGDPATAR